MKILVTGGAGFVGSHLVDKLLKLKHKVVIVDNLSSGQKKFVRGGDFYKLDIRSPKIKTLFKKYQFDLVFHLAAQKSVPFSLKNPQKDAEDNILGTLNLLENCLNYKVKKFIFTSTGGAIYDQADKFPTPETASAKPLSPYAIAKFSAEKYIQFYGKIKSELNFVKKLSDDFPGSVREIFPPLATLLKKLQQQVGDLYRWKGQRMLDKIDELNSGTLKILDVMTNGDRMIPFLFQKISEQKILYGKAEKYLIDAEKEYKEALKFFPSETERTGRQQFEFDLYQQLIKLVECLMDFDKRKDNVPYEQQRYYGMVIAAYLDIAEVFDENGYNRKSIYFINRAFDEIRKLVYRGVDAMANIQARVRQPERYEKEGWYEKAKTEYLLLSDERLLQRLYQGLVVQKKVEWPFAEDYAKQAMVGFLAMERVCRKALNPAEAERTIEELKTQLNDKYASFIVK